MRKNKKGFTLIEILAAVTILGILSIVAIVSVNKVIQKSKQNHYVTAEDNLEMAGQSYVQQNRNALPKAIGQKKKIPLKILVEKNYIEPIKDYSDNECDLENSYVQIFKYSQDDYSYIAYLDCPVYDSKEQFENGAPRTYIVLTDTGKTKTAQAHIKAEDDEKLLSWSYMIYKNGKEVLNSGSVMIPSYDKSVEKSLDISKYTPGKIKVIVTATNIYGLTTTTTSEVKEYKDEQAPTCIIKDVDKIVNPKPWTQSAKTITVGCDDGEGSGCTREEYTKTFKTTTINGDIIIEDNSGNKTTCEVSVYVDTTAPTCTVTFTGTSGLDGWYKTSPATAIVASTDTHSGVKIHDITTSETPSYNGNTTGIQSDTSGTIWYGYVMDNVGNVASCNNTVKVDTTPPTCTVSLSGTSGTNGWYKEKNVTVTLNPSDALSGVGQTGLSINETPSLGSTKTGTQGNTSGIIWYGRVKDKAGNIGEVCNSGTFKVDKTKPSISFTTDTGPHKSNTGITVYSSCSDSLSGVSSQTGSSSVSSPTSSSGNSVTHSCTDNAGNSNSTTDKFKVKYYSATSACDVKEYHSCKHSSCGSYCLTCKPCFSGFNVRTCEEVEEQTWVAGKGCCSKTSITDCGACGSDYKSCPNSSCAPKSYYECWHY